MPPDLFHLQQGIEDESPIAECGRRVSRDLLVPRHQDTLWKSVILSNLACLDCVASMFDGDRARAARAIRRLQVDRARAARAIRRLQVDYLANRSGVNGYVPD